MIAGIRSFILLLSGCLMSLAAEPPPEAWAEYEQTVRPLLEKFCWGCHGEDRAKGGIALDQVADVEALRGDAVTWQSVLQQVALHTMPPEGRPQPDWEERETIRIWIDRVLYPVDCEHPDPGHITLRRLNRAEYDHTIRDLFGVDLKPAARFPADDSGYGFDNIADVLTLSPMHMEKYFQAAEEILDQVLVTDPPGPVQVVLKPDALSGGALREGERVLATVGQVQGSHAFPVPGRYRVHIQAGAQQAGDEPARMDVRVGNKPWGTHDVKNGTDRLLAYRSEVEVPAGPARISVGFLNDFYDPDHPDPARRDRNLWVGEVMIEGPLDAAQPELPPSHRRVFTVEPTPGRERQAAQDILVSFTRRAYRRPAGPDEIDRLLGVYDAARGEDHSFAVSVKWALKAVLISPRFLFRERGAVPPGPGPHPVDEYTLASRLSYFLWASMPDDELLDLAEAGALSGQLPAQARRMLQDPKAASLARQFGGQWLQFRDMDLVEPAPSIFPAFDDTLRQAMVQETLQFVEYLVAEDRPVMELISADYTFLNERLAQHYGIEGVSGPAFRKVELADPRRGGILGHGSFLTLTSNPNRTSPVKRGKWVLDNLLGTPPPPPPDDVPPLEEAGKQLTAATLREQLALHREDPVCASCHQIMDPLGLSLEYFNGIGARRSLDNGQPIDATGTLVSGESFEDLAGLRRVLLDTRREDVVHCLTEKMLTYALGRGLEPDDRCAVNQVITRAAGENYRVSSLVVGIVESHPFTRQRGTDEEPELADLEINLP